MVQENNVSIMDDIIEDHPPSQYQLAIVNSVRVWLRVITVSVIIDIEGRHIKPWAPGGTRRRQSFLVWPRQARPTINVLKLWRTYITTTFGNPTTTSNSTEVVPLEKRLGLWLHQPHTQHTHYWDTTNLFTLQDNNSFQIHIPLHRGNQAFEIESTSTMIPSHSTPLKAFRLSSFHYITSLSKQLPPYLP